MPVTNELETTIGMDSPKQLLARPRVRDTAEEGVGRTFTQGALGAVPAGRWPPVP